MAGLDYWSRSSSTQTEVYTNQAAQQTHLNMRMQFVAVDPRMDGKSRIGVVLNKTVKTKNKNDCRRLEIESTPHNIKTEVKDSNALQNEDAAISSSEEIGKDTQQFDEKNTKKDKLSCDMVDIKEEALDENEPPVKFSEDAIVDIQEKGLDDTQMSENVYFTSDIKQEVDNWEMLETENRQGGLGGGAQSYDMVDVKEEEDVEDTQMSGMEYGVASGSMTMVVETVDQASNTESPVIVTTGVQTILQGVNTQLLLNNEEMEHHRDSILDTGVSHTQTAAANIQTMLPQTLIPFYYNGRIFYINIGGGAAPMTAKLSQSLPQVLMHASIDSSSTVRRLMPRPIAPKKPSPSFVRAPEVKPNRVAIPPLKKSSSTSLPLVGVAVMKPNIPGLSPLINSDLQSSPLAGVSNLIPRIANYSARLRESNSSLSTLAGLSNLTPNIPGFSAAIESNSSSLSFLAASSGKSNVPEFIKSTAPDSQSSSLKGTANLIPNVPSFSEPLESNTSLKGASSVESNIPELSALFDDEESPDIEALNSGSDNQPPSHIYCDICCRKVPQASWKRHVWRRCKNHKSRCQLCKEVFFTSAEVAEHVNMYHVDNPTEKETLKCKICSFVTKNGILFRDHIRTHTGEKMYICDQCGKKFALRTHLQAHVLRHKKSRPFVCKICGNSYKTKDYLKRHEQYHAGKRPYSCELCNMRFTVKTSLQTHMRKHTGEKPYKCDICGEGFTSPALRRSHVFAHTGFKPHSCETCGKGFIAKKNYHKHLESHST